MRGEVNEREREKVNESKREDEREGEWVIKLQPTHFVMER